MAQIKSKQIKLVAEGDFILGDSSANGSILSIGAASQVIISNATTGAWGYLGQLIDPTGTVVVNTGTTPSQVNNITISGGAAGTGPTFTALGSDTNIDINLTVKGTGQVLVPISYVPSQPNSLVTKQYSDALITGLDFKNSSRAATVSSADLAGFTYTASSDNETVGAAPWTNVVAPVFDGITLVDGDRVLIKDSPDAKGNGIFTYDDGANTFVRAIDADNSPENEVSGGMFTFVEEGSTQADTGWVAAAPNGNATLGVTDIIMTQFSEAGVILPGLGLSQTGQNFNVNVDDFTTVIDGFDQVVSGHDDSVDHTGQFLAGQDASGGKATAIWTYVEDLRDTTTGDFIIDGISVGSSVNNLQVTNSITGNPVLVESVGADTNINLNLTAKGTGRLNLDGTLWPDAGVAARSVLVTQDGSANDLSEVTAPDGAGNQILTYTDSTNTIEWVAQAAAGGNAFSTITGDTGSATADSTSDSLLIAGGEGIVTVAADDPEVVTIDMDIDGLVLGTDIAGTDEIVVYDISTATHVKVTINEFLDDNIVAFTTVAGDSGSAIADIRTDTLTIAGGEGIVTVGADDPESITVDMDIDGLILQTDIDRNADELVIYDASTGGHRKVLISDLVDDSAIAFRNVAGDSGLATADDASDTLTIAGGEGIVTIATDNPEILTIDLDINGLVLGTDITATDEIVIYDVSTNTHVKVTINELLDDNIIAFTTVSGDSGSATADIRTDSITIAGGEGIVTVGADDPETLTIDLDINGLILGTNIVGGDEIVIYDVSTNTHVKVTINELLDDNIVAFTTMSGDTGAATADIRTDAITFIGGEAIITTAANDPETMTFDLDIVGLPTLTGPDPVADVIVIYDDSTNTHKKTTIQELFVDAGVGAVKYDDVSASGASNEVFAAFFTSTPLADEAITVFFNGLSLRDTGWTSSGTTLTMVDAVNGYSTEAGDIISARYETAPV